MRVDAKRAVGVGGIPAQSGGWELRPFVTGVCHFLAHDLSNAISALSITVDLLAGQQDLSEKSRELVHRVMNLQGRLHALADALGALGGARLRPQPLELGVRLEAILKLLKLRERFAVELDLAGLQGTTCTSPAPDLIDFCLRLLLRNAAEATPAGGSLGVRVGAEPGKLRITIWDEGEGVPPTLRDRLFRDVFSTKGARGVSLLLVRAAVEGALQGGVGYAPNEPVGSRFILDLPTG
jgi:two-component system, NtrC family, sensor histidine kinase HydH